MDREDLIAAPRQIDTPRLHLESPRIEHASAFAESLNASLESLTFIGWARVLRDVPWAERFCERGRQAVESGEDLIFSAFERDSGVYVGRIDLHTWDFEAPRCEVGYVGDVRLRGTGLMREAVLAVVQMAFDLGVARVQALSEAGNLRAVHFAETALGFTREGVLRNYERDTQGQLGEQVLFAAYNPRAV